MPQPQSQDKPQDQSSSSFSSSDQPITLTRIPLTLTSTPSPPHLLQIINTLLPSWHTDPSTLQITHHNNFTNANAHVQRPSPSPTTLFIKFHNTHSPPSFAIWKPLLPTNVSEANICHDYAATGHGAQTYGIFQTQDGLEGRIDEFLDARNLQPHDVEDATIRASIASTLAVFHTMPTSAPLKPVSAVYDALIPAFKKYHGLAKLKSLGAEAGVNVDALIDYDFAAKVTAVVSKLSSLNAKAALCLHDVQFMNVLVKNNPSNDEHKTVLIDFEFALRNYRAFDIGGHFMQKLFKWFDEESKIANCQPYSESEKKHFCEAYTKQWNQTTGDSDTAEQVYLEAQYGYMLAIAFDVHNMLAWMYDMDDKDPLNALGLNKLLDEFVAQYAKMGL